jgi:hypothetical protein
MPILRFPIDVQQKHADELLMKFDEVCVDEVLMNFDEL